MNETVQPGNTSVIVATTPATSASADKLRAGGDLARGIAVLIWPIFAIIVVHLFKQEIRQLIGRMKGGKFWGAEVELDSVVADLQQKVSEIKPTSVPGTADTTLVKEFNANKITEREVSQTNRLLNEVQAVLNYSATAALVLVGSAIESELRDLVEISSGKESASAMMRKNQTLLQQKNVIAADLAEAMNLFWRTRNVVLHASENVSESNIRKAIDAGIGIMASLVDIETRLFGIQATEPDQ